MHFTTLAPQPDDPILGLMTAFAADRRDDKIDLGIGVYRDEHGRTPIMRAVKQAENGLVATQATKGYLGVDGDPVFVELLGKLAFGEELAAFGACGVQVVGGTGALRMAADLLALERPGRTVWLGLPSWPNHAAIFAATGLKLKTFSHADEHGGFNLAALEQVAARAAPGDVVVLHGACHNPTGIDPDAAQWAQIGALLAQHDLLPLIDMAYHGLGLGLDEDRLGLRALVRSVPAALVAYSCSKNFALYRERVGALFVTGQSDGKSLVQSNLIALARANYSMPPDHGAAVVRAVLSDPTLHALWAGELAEMGERVRALRLALAAHGGAGPVDLAMLERQNGFFAMLPLDAGQVVRLREEHGIYIAPNGRTNLAGLRQSQIAPFVAALGALGR